VTPSGWHQREWGELAELRYGKALKGYRDGDGTTTVFGTNGSVGSTLTEPQSKGPGVIVGRKGAYRGIHYSSGPFYVIDTAFWLNPLVEMDMRWAYYELLTHDINGMDSGSAIPSTSRDAFYKMAVTVPPLPEQRLIAATLGALDDKIASNLRSIKLTEGLGDALLREHITFDRTGEPIWQDAPLGEMLSLLETGSRPRGGIKDIIGGVVSLGAENVQSAGISKAKRFRWIPREYADGMKRGRLTDGDLLIYKDGGKPGNFIPHVSAFGYGFPVAEAAINEHVYRARAAAPVSQGVLYWLDREMRNRGTGAAIPGLNSTNFRSLPFPLFDDDALRDLAPVLDRLLERALMLGSENASLARLRDELLPELISGRTWFVDTVVQGAIA
jgi:type I restriction enzyme S subunit